ncbi:MAG: polyphosphate kinase 2 family protein, partial [Methanospirillum sp.]|uniref:PPK2 family polyphosphate kinase n=1 Tax=Methanospirillum sp. TaxID=45200 RepID=UPI00236D53F0
MKLDGPKIKNHLNDFVVKPGKRVNLNNFDTGWAQNEKMKRIGEEKSKDLLTEMLEQDRDALSEVQDILWSSRTHAILIILQGMDTSGKDGTIRHVMSGMNPQGCSVHGFKVPTDEEHNHDFLWRYAKVLPQDGEIGIFNRSYYEDVLVVKVHPEIIADLPAEIGTKAKNFWEGRYKDINAFEKHLVRNGTLVLKFFLHISKEEQKKRLLDRLEHKDKYWKFSISDLAERRFWNQYTKAYEEMLHATSTTYAPWFVV